MLLCCGSWHGPAVSAAVSRASASACAEIAHQRTQRRGASSRPKKAPSDPETPPRREKGTLKWKDLPGSPAKPQPQIPIDVTSLRLDHEPVLFLRRYERLFDMSLVRPAADRREKEEEEAAAEKKRKKEEEADSDVSERVNFVLKTFQATNSFDNMLNRMRPSKPQEWDELLGRNKESLEANLQQALDGPRQHAKPTWVAVDSVAEKPSPVLDKLVELSMKTMETIGLVPAAKANEEAKEEAKKVTELELQTGSEILRWYSTHMTPRQQVRHYLTLSKSRLSTFVALSAVAGAALAPVPTSALTLAVVGAGTFLTSASANAINQFLEVPFDSQMARTQNRVLVRGHLTPAHAMAFAAASGVAGTALLAGGANGLTAALGLVNLSLYTMCYTPMKRIRDGPVRENALIANTWVGAVVGGLPPLMGYAAATGSLDAASLILAGVLYSWQFPHFNALSWNLRADYSKAGYRMMSVTHPDLCKRVALRHSLAIVALCSVGAPALGVTNTTFAFGSLPINMMLVLLAVHFYRDGTSKSSRALFRYTLLHLPLLLLVMWVSKKSLWENKAVKGTAAATAAPEAISV